MSSVVQFNVWPHTGCRVVKEDVSNLESAMDYGELIRKEEIGGLKMSAWTSWAQRGPSPSQPGKLHPRSSAPPGPPASAQPAFTGCVNLAGHDVSLSENVSQPLPPPCITEWREGPPFVTNPESSPFQWRKIIHSNPLSVRWTYTGLFLCPQLWSITNS